MRALALGVALAACVSLARAELAAHDEPPPPAPAADPMRPENSLRERGLIDLNAADEGTLTLLPRVGPALARRIVEHRAAEGPFSRVDDLLEVKGIGPKTLALIRPMAAVSEAIPEVGEPHRGREAEVAGPGDAGPGEGEHPELRADEPLSGEQHVE